MGARFKQNERPFLKKRAPVFPNMSKWLIFNDFILDFKITIEAYFHVKNYVNKL